MRLRGSSFNELSAEAMSELERQAHDKDYQEHRPYGMSQLRFRRDDVWRICDRAFRRGAYRRGWRKRRLFESMQLDSIQGQCVLDVGCGNGDEGVFIAMYGAKVSGFDLSSVGIANAIKLAEANGLADHCDFQVANAMDLPYQDAQFDVVVMNAVLHHLIKYPGVQEEVSRVLKPGGVLYVADGLRDNVAYRFLRRLRNLFRRAAGPLGDVDLELDDLHAFTRGFHDVSIEQFSLFEKLKDGFGRSYDNPLRIRAVYYLLNKIDDVLFALVPPVRRWSLEFVLRAVKS